MLTWLALKKCLHTKRVLKILVAVGTMLCMLISSLLPVAVAEDAAEAVNTLPVWQEGTPLLTLIADGESGYAIVHGAAATKTEQLAAKELQSYLQTISGVLLPVHADNDSVTWENEILVGKTNRAADSLIDREMLGDDGYQILVQGETLLLAGGELRGTLYGVYAFLEDYLGCRWFTSDVSVIPQQNTVALPADTEVTQTPAFLFRDTSWICTWDAAWRAKQGLNGSLTAWHSPLDESYAPALNFGGGDAGHTFRFFVPEEVYFESHPEYFSVDKNGKPYAAGRMQVCLSNPDVLQLTIDGVLQWIRENPTAEYFSVSQNDNMNYCHCAACAAVDAANASCAGTMLTFVNKVAAAVKEAGYDVMIHTFAYQYTRTPPTQVRPADNVMVQLCSIECNHAAPYTQTDPDFYADLQGWRAICDKLFVWDYNTAFRHYLTPFPDISIMQANIQMFYENNAIGYFMQGNSGDKSGEFGELRAYLIAKLLWDPNCDLQAHMEEFLCYYYGPGYKNIAAYIALLEKKDSDNYNIFSDPEKILTLNKYDLEQCDLWWDTCEQYAANDAQLARIQRSRLQLQYYKSVARKGEFSMLALPREREEAGRALHEQLQRFGFTCIREGRTLQENPNYKDKASTWNN